MRYLDEEQQRWRENSFTKEEVGISTPDPRGSIPATPPRSAEATGRVPSLRVSVDTAAYERTNAKRSHANDGNTSPDPRSKRFKSYDDSVCRTSEFQSSGERDAGIQSLVENVAASGVLGDDLIWSEARTVFRDAIKQRLFAMYQKCGFLGPPSESFDSRLRAILVKFDRYDDAPPFTLQRLAELLCIGGDSNSPQYGAGNSIDTITDGDVMTTRPRSRSVYGAHGFLRAQYTETHKYANAIEKTLGVSSSRY